MRDPVGETADHADGRRWIRPSAAVFVAAAVTAAVPVVEADSAAVPAADTDTVAASIPDEMIFTHE